MPKSTTNALGSQDSSHATMRGVLRRGWNNVNTQTKIEGFPRKVTPFRAANNLGDYLSRKYYICGGSNPSNAMKPGIGRRFGSMLENCGNTKKVDATYTNLKWVSDSSDYIRFKKEQAYVKNHF